MYKESGCRSREEVRLGITLKEKCGARKQRAENSFNKMKKAMDYLNNVFEEKSFVFLLDLSDSDVGAFGEVVFICIRHPSLDP